MKAVFLDRDGVINKPAIRGGYILRREQFELMSGIVSAVKYFNKSGFLVIVVTNQQCVARGIITKQELEDLHWFMILKFIMEEAVVNKVFYCPHFADQDCTCRKPKPGMFFVAENLYNIDLKSSWMVGDSATDIEAGKAAGCKTILLIDGVRNLKERDECQPDFVINSLAEIQDIIK